jgi:hypothetical protein
MKPTPARAYAALAAACLAVLAAGCTYYQTVPATPSGPSKYDRAWNAALGAASDVGVTVTSTDRTSGTIYGTTTSDDVTIRVLTQADGRVRVEFSARGPTGTDAVVANQLSQAYNRRMGR